MAGRILVVEDSETQALQLTWLLEASSALRPASRRWKN